MWEQPAGRPPAAEDRSPHPDTSVGDRVDDISAALDLLREHGPTSRNALAESMKLGRKALNTLLEPLLGLGLVVPDDPAPPSGGRPSRRVRFRPERGRLLVAQLGATAMAVAVTELDGRVLQRHHERHDMAAGPEVILSRVEELLSAMAAESAPADDAPVWGMGVGLPGPVEFASGRPVAPPLMPGWDGYPVRDRLALRFGVPVWVDNDVNIMALGELHGGEADGHRDIVYLKIGTGIGAALLSDGRLHRGANGAAGDLGHVAAHSDRSVLCPCGRLNCLEALAGGAALIRDATEEARRHDAGFLAETLREQGELSLRDIATAARRGDGGARALLAQSGRLVGDTLATVVNFYNPTVIVIGGRAVVAGDLILSPVRHAVFQRSLPLATRDLRIIGSVDSRHAGLRGAARLAADELFSPSALASWLPHGSPVGRPETVHATGTERKSS
ncbi:ROK family protein [Streptomyces sp. NPDC091215]|uniref:ROK family protein n=1 Tax=Streptomyces sp. NPDC091215 TaxID=3155192 RepID=UPI0034142C22